MAALMTESQRFDKSLSMYLDQLPSVRVTELRRSGAVTPDTANIIITL